MIQRGLLRWGVFLLALGLVPLLAQAGWLDRATARDALVLWPLVLIGFGAALLLRRTPAGLATSIVAAAMPGLLLGGVVVAAPDVGPDCRPVPPAGFDTHQGTFDAALPVFADLALDCGTLTVTTAPGNGWEVRTGQTGQRAPGVDESPGRLVVGSASSAFHTGVSGGDTIEAVLPADRTLELKAVVNAGRGQFDLRSSRIGRFDVAVNAGSGAIDLTGSTVDWLTIRANAGSVAVRFPASDLNADLRVYGGKLELCLPADLAVRIRSDVTFGSVDHAGLVRDGTAWQTAGYETASHRAEIAVSARIGNVELNPKGGCS